MTDSHQRTAQSQFLHLLRRKDVLAGLMFLAVAAFGLWVSRDYAVGSAVRMGTGYVPRFLCWVLLGLGAIILMQGLRQSNGALERGPSPWRALIFIPAALLAFAYTIGSLGVAAAIVLMTIVGSFAGREMRPLEVAAAAVVLVVATVAIFIWGIGLPIPIWPEW